MVDTASLASAIKSVANQIDISGLSNGVAEAIHNAAVRTGVDFSYLLKKAAQESGFDPNAKASSSSATGLYQFTNQTWLQMIKQHGADYGVGSYASKIQMDSNGHASVSDLTAKQAILALRNDPQISAEMAGELDKSNLQSLKDNVGGKIGSTDLYMAHFLGAGGASDFLNAMKTNPNAKAATVLPDAASANPSVFYTNSGEARSLSDVYQRFAKKFDGGGSSAIVTVAQAATTSAGQLASTYGYVARAYQTASTNNTSIYVQDNKSTQSSLPTNGLGEIHTVRGAGVVGRSVAAYGSNLSLSMAQSESLVIATLGVTAYDGMTGADSHIMGAQNKKKNPDLFSDIV